MGLQLGVTDRGEEERGLMVVIGRSEKKRGRPRSLVVLEQRKGGEDEGAAGDRHGDTARGGGDNMAGMASSTVMVRSSMERGGRPKSGLATGSSSSRGRSR